MENISTQAQTDTKAPRTQTTIETEMFTHLTTLGQKVYTKKLLEVDIENHMVKVNILDVELGKLKKTSASGPELVTT